MRTKYPVAGLYPWLALAAWIDAPAHAQQRAIDRNLIAAGFVMRPADTPQKMERLKTLPAHKFVARSKEGWRYYIYADPTDCKCAFVGYQGAYDTYRDMVAPSPPPGVRDFATAARPGGADVDRELVHEMDEDAGMFDADDILHPGF